MNKAVQSWDDIIGPILLNFIVMGFLNAKLISTLLDIKPYALFSWVDKAFILAPLLRAVFILPAWLGAKLDLL